MARGEAEPDMSEVCSSSVSFSEIQEKRAHNGKSKTDVLVCVVSDDDSSGAVSKRRLKFDDSGRYKLRAKIQGVERFNPLAKTPGEIAQMKRRRMEKRRRELEDDAATPLKPGEDHPLEEDHNVGRKSYSPEDHVFKRPASKHVSEGKVCSSSKGGLSDMLHQMNEQLRSAPGVGKHFRKKSKSSSVEVRQRSLEPEREKTPASKAGTSVPRKSETVHKMLDRAWDDPIWDDLRADFELPSEYENVRTTRQQEPDEESDDLVAVNKEAAATSESGKEFGLKLEQELIRPFSSRELEKKLSCVSEQKRIVKSLELRGQRIVEFPTDKEGLSYLDHHPDFAKALKLAATAEEKLKLLRGFFFWIEHACMKNSFVPWAKPPKKDDVIVID